MRSLSLGQQITIWVSIVLVLSASFILSQSLIPVAVVLALLSAALIVRNPVAVIFAFIVSNVALELRPKYMIHGGAPGPLELIIAILMSGILAYWVVRLRIFEGQVLSESFGQLSMAFFAIWSFFVTAVMLRGAHASFPNALREMIDFVPLLILPILYSRFVDHDSKWERRIFAAVFFSGLLLIAWNILQMRNNVVAAVYLYQMGRGSTDDTLASFTVILSVSFLMSFRRGWATTAWAIVLLLASIGVIISFKRDLYVATIICAMLVLFLGSNEERRRATIRLLMVAAVGLVSLAFLYFSSHIFHLLLLSYGLRFMSTQHLGTDLSLVNRYVEWHYEWQAILRSPIFGHGFGAQFRTFDMIRGFNSWMTFSHSSYLYMIFKTGFVGAILFFAAYFSFLAKGFRLIKLKNLSPRARVITRAILGYLIIILFSALTEPELDSKTDLIWVGLMWGYFLALESHSRSSESMPFHKIVQSRV